MKVAGHIWAAVTNLIATAVVLAMFSRTSGAFETMVIAALTLIYITVISSTALLSRAYFEGIQISARQFAKLARLLNDPEWKNYEEEIKETTLAYKSLTTRFYINAQFSSLDNRDIPHISCVL